MSPLHTIKIDKKIITVTELNQKSKFILEHQLNQLWIEGEVSNLSQPSSGHIYFTLKDRHAQIRCALFKSSHSNHRNHLKNGALINVFAKVSLYEPRGDYQLIVSLVEPAGVGVLQAQFEALKNKLSTQGLFDTQRKQALPKYPKKIGIIASKHSAAIKDVITTLNRRFPAIPLIIIPSDVQGKSAAGQLSNAIYIANANTEIEVIILARGGGSIEDLWAFNDEQLAHSIANSAIPIVTGIGHEVDFTIADFVADFRAPTPTAAAEAVTVDALDLFQQLKHYEQRILFLIQNKTNSFKQLSHQLNKRLLSPSALIATQWQRLDHAENVLRKNTETQINKATQRLLIFKSRLDQQNPATKLKRYDSELKYLKSKLHQSMINHLLHLKQQLANSANLVDAYSPLATLDRGYTISLNNGRVITSINSIKAGDKIDVRFTDGIAHCTVDSYS